MRILSWNVNGLRALVKSGEWNYLMRSRPDVFCLQETKSHPEQLPDDVREPEGYFSYFSSSAVRKGYSGVALYSKEEPTKVEYGMGIKRFDEEGRFLEAHFYDFVLITCYFPNGGQGPHRVKYKLEFYDAFLEHIEKLRKDGQKIIFCGDVNTAHEEIDLARPKENEENTGFLPEERAWLDEVVAHGYVDAFRYFYPHKGGAYTYWDLKTRARDRNVGWRLDYFFASSNMISDLKNIRHLSDIMGSDHCPLALELKGNL